MQPNAVRVADRWLQAGLSRPRLSDIKWKPVGPAQYSGIGGRVFVDARKKMMTVDGKEYKLPRKPTFDHAEGILTEHYGW